MEICGGVEAESSIRPQVLHLLAKVERIRCEVQRFLGASGQQASSKRDAQEKSGTLISLQQSPWREQIQLKAHKIGLSKVVIPGQL